MGLRNWRIHLVGYYKVSNFHFFELNSASYNPKLSRNLLLIMLDYNPGSKPCLSLKSGRHQQHIQEADGLLLHKVYIS